jgi:hypothetical protein
VDLAAAVKKYLEITGGFDRPLHLSRFGLSHADTEKIFSAWDEDYQISRYLQFSHTSDEAPAPDAADLRVFAINGHESTHVSFRADIRRLLPPS